MRSHGWQLPYHPLQVVAIAVFLALGFAFYVFFAPFVGKKFHQYVAMGLYTPLVGCVFFLYIWCGAIDPADPGVLKSKKYLGVDDNGEHKHSFRKGASDSGFQGETTGEKQVHGTSISSEKSMAQPEHKNSSFCKFCPLSFLYVLCQTNEHSSEHEYSEEGMFFCSLCKVEVTKHSKHCRVCDKCVYGFDHHCRWLNNCIGRRNYGRFFILMTTALLLLILQWVIGLLVLVLCFIERKKFSEQIASKLGNSFSMVPFVIVVVSCTLLAMVATLPLAQLFFFHILLMKKGISTYDYIIALREEEQQEAGGQQSPQMSRMSSFTGLSSASSFAAIHRVSWCTPPRLFLEDQFDVIPSDIGTSYNSTGKKRREDDLTKKKGAGTVKISPWALARLNAEEVSRVAAEARKKSKVLRPVSRKDHPLGHETDSSYGNTSGRIALGPDNKRPAGRRGKLLADHSLGPLAKISASATGSNGSDMPLETPSKLAPLQLEARSAFHPIRTASSGNIAESSPDSSLDSPDLHSFRASSGSSGTEEVHGLTSVVIPGATAQKGIRLSRSTSDGYEASGGEDSDRIPSRIVHHSTNWSSVILKSGASSIIADRRGSSSGSLASKTRLL